MIFDHLDEGKDDDITVRELAKEALNGDDDALEVLADRMEELRKTSYVVVLRGEDEDDRQNLLTFLASDDAEKFETSKQGSKQTKVGELEIFVTFLENYHGTDGYYELYLPQVSNPSNTTIHLGGDPQFAKTVFQEATRLAKQIVEPNRELSYEEIEEFGERMSTFIEQSRPD